MPQKRWTFGFVSIILIGISLLGACANQAPAPSEETPSPATGEEVASEAGEEIASQERPLIEEEYEIKETSKGVKYIVDPRKIVGGGPPKDGIPSIDKPKFVSLEEADQWIQDNELVIAIIYKGEERVYPLQIMVWHEIVNEVIAGDPLLITY